MTEPIAWIDPRELDMAVSTSVTKHKQFDTDIPLYTHPAKIEEFMAGDAICPSCGCKSLYKTARSEWCVTHKCLWQKDYELKLTDEEIGEVMKQCDWQYDPESFARAILRKAQ